MNRLPKVKDFIRGDREKFDLPVEYVGGDPRIVFFDENDTEIKVIDITFMDGGQIKDVLEAHGIKERI